MRRRNDVEVYYSIKMLEITSYTWIHYNNNNIESRTGTKRKKKNEAEAHFKTYFGPLNIINILFGNTQLSSARVRSLDGNIRYNG